MPKLLLGKEPILTKLAFELQYENGYVFLDRCGSIITEILAADSAWLVGSVSPPSAALFHAQTGCILNFGNDRLALALEQRPNEPGLSEKDFDRFRETADSICQLILQRLGIKGFARVEFRVWNLFACSSQQDSERWLRQLAPFTIASGLSTSFGGEPTMSSAVIILKLPNRFLRLSIGGVHKQPQVEVGGQPLKLPKRAWGYEKVRLRLVEKDNPEHGVLIDSDLYLDDPPVLIPSDFILSSWEILWTGLQKYGSD